MFSEITKQRLYKFKNIRRAYYAFWILTSLLILSLFSELLLNEKPLYIHYKSHSYFPAFSFYPGLIFDQPQDTEADYIALRKDKLFLKKAFVVWAPYCCGPYHSYLEDVQPPPHLPSLGHWLGTDRLGRDVLARLFYGFRTSMLFSLYLTVIMAILGVFIGGIQGYWGTWVDLSIQRIIEIWSALPFLYVVILIGSLYGRSFGLLLFVISLFHWIGLSYYIRGEFLKGKKASYVQAARALGLSGSRIFLRHILPNSLTPLVTILPFGMITGITVLTALDFLGFGLQPPSPSWGELLKQSLDVIHEFPHLTIVTSLVFFFTLILATLVGEGVREAFDPRAEKNKIFIILDTIK